MNSCSWPAGRYGTILSLLLRGRESRNAGLTLLLLLVVDRRRFSTGSTVTRGRRASRSGQDKLKIVRRRDARRPSYSR